MKIVILGASGQVGEVLASEALSRGHEVIGVTRRNIPKILNHPRATHIQGDINDGKFLYRVVTLGDVIVNALRPMEGHESQLVEMSLNVQDACAKIGVRMIVSGGAASLFTSVENNVKRVIDTEFVQDAWRDIAKASVKQYDSLIENNSGSDWTYIAAPAMFIEGNKRGGYRLSYSQLVTDSEGKSELTWSDFCDIIMNEIEHPSENKLITGAYQ